MEKRIDDTIHEIINEMIKSDSFGEYDIEGIILTGSYISDNRHKKSDIDIFIVINEKLAFIRHNVFRVKDKIVQVRVCSYDKFKSDCELYENKRPAAYACKVLFDKNGICQKAIDNSKKYLVMGPKKLSNKEVTKLVNTIKNELETAEGLIDSNNIVAATILINQLVMMLVEYYNDKYGYWMSNSNYLFTELKEHNIKLGYLAENIILENNIDTKFNDLKYLCETKIPDWKNVPGEYTYDEYYG